MGKQSQSLLTAEEVIKLNNDFKKYRLSIPCPTGTCKAISMAPNGFAPHQQPKQPRFKCRTCSKGNVTAATMQKMINKIALEGQQQHPPPADLEMEHETTNHDPTSSQFSTETLHYIINELNSQKEQIERHETVFEELCKTKEKLEEATRRINELEQIEQNLRQQLEEKEQQKEQQDTNFPPLRPTLQGDNIQNSMASNWAHHIRKAAARVFQYPTNTHGFQYVYLPSRARIPVGKMRGTLRRFGIDNSQILDIQYPARQTIGLLVHNDFTSILLEQLAERNIHPVPFDPLDSKNIHDQKYENEPLSKRQEIAHELRSTRAKRAITFIRPPIKFAVARDFHTKGWISVDDLKAILATNWVHRDEPEELAKNFQSDDELDDFMETDHQTNQKGQNKRTYSERGTSPTN
ncbi:hypothetical protein INT45_002930 [Circinella minor]|uniref:Uncharacterized protein n=1 Tax=Circinella minor TaxID=1195481 RepID=A0A8H7VIS2_9FUNG|nr:hypothetical protein INT45_002930 [Circinella minor]